MSLFCVNPRTLELPIQKLAQVIALRAVESGAYLFRIDKTLTATFGSYQSLC